MPGCREIALADVNVMLVPPDDAGALADAVGLLAADRDLRQRFGAEGRRLVEERFSDVVIDGQIRAIYDHLTDRRAG